MVSNPIANPLKITNVKICDCSFCTAYALLCLSQFHSNMLQTYNFPKVYKHYRDWAIFFSPKKSLLQSILDNHAVELSHLTPSFRASV